MIINNYLFFIFYKYVRKNGNGRSYKNILNNRIWRQNNITLELIRRRSRQTYLS